MAQDERIAKLARHIEDLAREDHLRLLRERDVGALRRQAACQLHSICAAFAASVNQRLALPILELSPPRYTGEAFRQPGVNLIQLNAHGRILQVAFEATRELFSTEKFRIPYILEGEVRAYNQELLERIEIRSQLLFFCIEERGDAWHYFDWRSNRTGLFDSELLLRLMEGLV